jgi:drug/metabolite transporter (DMT)-like permease
MNHSPHINTRSSAFRGALYMVLAGVAFAVANAITQTITFGLGFKPQSDTFWQYLIALLFSLPFLWQHGASALQTRHPGVHILRVIVSALGVQAFVMSLANGVPIWQVIALVMTSPFFVILGARFVLGERVGPERWIAATVAFVGAMVILKPWSTGFTLFSLLPVVAASMWGAASLITKTLTRDETPESITAWLLLLLTPINAVLSARAGFELPAGSILWLLLLGGLVMFAAQYLLTRSYAAADAAFVQPFDDLKLISNIVVGGLVFGYWPEGNLWVGVACILAASAFLLFTERRSESRRLQMA